FDEEHGNLDVVVRAESNGDAMWASESTAGDVALLRVPVASFTRSAEEAPASAYTRLPTPAGYTFQNRFVGDWLLYGTGQGWSAGKTTVDGRAFAYRLPTGGSA